MITLKGQDAAYAELHKLGRKVLKEVFGKDFPPYLYFDRPCGNFITDGEEGRGCGLIYRVRFGKCVAGWDMCLPPISSNGEMILIGSREEFAFGMCRSLYLEAKKVLASDIVAISGSYKTPPLIDTLCENYRYNHNYPIVLQGDTYPPEVLTPVMVWMQNYVEWWEKYSGEKV